jgi:hypothetical protein
MPFCMLSHAPVGQVKQKMNKQDHASQIHV